MLARLRGHASGGPSGVASQSTASRSRPTAPPPSSTARALPPDCSAWWPSAIGGPAGEPLGGIGHDVEHLREPGQVEDADHRLRLADGDREAVAVLLRALLLA